MPVATTHAVSLHGAVGHLIDVQTDVSPGQVGVTMVGRPDATLPALPTVKPSLSPTRFA